MCGIFGGCFPSVGLNLDHKMTCAMEALSRRGPDGRGLATFPVRDGRVVLGHTRLSIIDLTSGGHQPMHSQDGRYTIIFNGEIYNYRELRQEIESFGHKFLSDSDTEVLLAAWAYWKKSVLVRLNGMFAFIIYDALEQTLTCIRDAFGIKPLFYSIDGETFVFASEIPSLVHLLPRRPEFNLQQVYDYLVFGRHDHSDNTFFKNVNLLLPGQVLVFGINDNKILSQEQWWWPRIDENTKLSFNDASKQLREMFLANVRLQLRSDVPLGVTLSGGVDSSSIICAMRQIEPDMPIESFSYIARGSPVDEEKWVDIVNNHVGAIPHKIIISQDELVEDLDDLVTSQGEPFRGTTIYAQYRVYKRMREQGITVALDGQGADELLAGYSGYESHRLVSLLELGKFGKAFSFLNEWSKWPGRSIGYALLLLGRELVPEKFQKTARHLVGKSTEPKWLNIDYLKSHGVVCAPNEPLVDTGFRGRRLVAALRSSLRGSGLASLLRHGDRNSMRWSVESRVPFLTIDMAEFMLSMPEEYLVSPQGETKSLFKSAMRGIVPDAILDRRDKVGFSTPEKQWLKLLEPSVNEWVAIANELPFLDGKYVKEEIAGILNGTRPFNRQAWCIINFCLWLRNQGPSIETLKSI